MERIAAPEKPQAPSAPAIATASVKRSISDLSKEDFDALDLDGLSIEELEQALERAKRNEEAEQ